MKKYSWWQDFDKGHKIRGAKPCEDEKGEWCLVKDAEKDSKESFEAGFNCGLKEKRLVDKL